MRALYTHKTVPFLGRSIDNNLKVIDLKSDSNRRYDYIATLFFLDFLDFVTKVENLKHAFSAEFIFLPN